MKTIQLLLPLVSTILIAWQLFTGAILYKGRMGTTRAEAPGWYWSMIAIQVAIAVYLWVAVSRSDRQRD